MIGRIGWNLFAAGATLATAAATRKAVKAAWRKTKGSEPPENPASPGTSWPEAISWATATGVTVAMARLFARRGAAAGWRKATGSLPPGVAEGRA